MTFTNEAPSKFKDLPDMTAMYQGGFFEIHKLLNYSIDPEDDALTHTATTNVSANLVSVYMDDINSIMTVRASPDLNEAFSVDVTATDPFGNSYSQSMDVLGVTSCPQANCNSCMGLGASDCTGCETGFVANNGECVSITCDCSGSGRNLSPTPIEAFSNMGLTQGTFLFTLLFFVSFLVVTVTLHLMIILLGSKLEGSEDLVRSLKTIRGWFEFGIYYHLIVFASPLLFLASLNGLVNSEILTGFYTNSDAFYVAIISLLLVLAFLPIISTMTGKAKRHFSTGIKKDRKARLFYTVMMLKFLAYSTALVFIDSFIVKMGSIIAVTLISSIYLIWAKPFELEVSNKMSIMNETLLLIVSILRISLVTNLSGLFTLTLSGTILISFVLSLTSQMYTMYHKCKNPNLPLTNVIETETDVSKQNECF